MIGILKNIFKNKKDNDITDNPFVIKASPEILELQRKCKLRAFNEEFSKQDYLKIEKIEIFKSFVLGEIFINSIEGNTVLSVQEKKDLGLSTRHKATKEILDFLNLNNIPSEKLKTSSLKKIILNFYNRVYSNLSHLPSHCYPKSTLHFHHSLYQLSSDTLCVLPHRYLLQKSSLSNYCSRRK